jgi:hypothetical protein
MPLAYNSTLEIKLKPCSCGCGKKGRWYKDRMLKDCYFRANPRTPIKKISEKRLARIEGGEQMDADFELPTAQHGAALERWFNDRHKEMTGRCMHCGGKSSKGTPMYKCSIAHILPKAYFKSVATHPLNWVELCFWGQSCHTNFDNFMLDITELNCFDTVIERFIAMYPHIDDKEKRRIPAALMNYIDIP